VHRANKRRRRGAIYARFSTRYQHSTQDQIRECQAWADANDILVQDIHIFFDEAESGKKSRRAGFARLMAAIQAKEIDVVIVFATNRLFRKTYKTLKFVEEEIVDRRMRCVFVKSGVDSDDKENFRKLLQIHALVDEMTIQMQVSHIRAAHEGQLRMGVVFGTLTYGFNGEDIPGSKTKRGKPARKLVIDAVTRQWVEQIFRWFTREGESIQEIARKLNEAKTPLPVRAGVTQWTSRIVRRMLDNPRYVGRWQYGATEAVWQNKEDYSRQFEREEPLCVVQLDHLRIIDDDTWHAAEKGLLACHARSGRKSNDGDRVSRPAVLNRFCFCHEHQRILYVGGSHGQYMFCPDCQVAAKPALFTMLPRKLATTMVCQTIAKLLVIDGGLVQQVIEACRGHAQALQLPDPVQLQELTRLEARLTSDIKFVLQCPGDSDQDRAENQARLMDLRQQRNEVQDKIRQLDKTMKMQVSIPTAEDVQGMLHQLGQILFLASSGGDQQQIAAARRIIDAVTGGRIEISQQGEAKSHRGWLRGTFQIHLVAPVLQDLGVVIDAHASREITIDFREVTAAEELADEAKALWDQKEPELLVKQIAIELTARHGTRINRNLVAKALNHWFESRGQTVPDGRIRRSTLEKKSMEPFIYEQIADRAMEMWKQGLLYGDIAKAIGVNRDTLTSAVKCWHEKRGLPVPDGRSRRKSLDYKGRPRSTDAITTSGGAEGRQPAGAPASSQAGPDALQDTATSSQKGGEEEKAA
jgi:DNA invertase Pin-like site-specific DNA recombinase